MKIIGIGNALVDVLVQLKDDSVLESLHLERGGMSLIDDGTHTLITNLLEQLHPAMSTGGSAGNTILALANMGAQPSFIGKVGQDNMGAYFAENCKKTGINAILLKGKEATGVANTFISEDGERTFATHLGAAASMTKDDVCKEWFEGQRLLYLEGYLVQNHELIETVAQMAKEAGMLIGIDLASYNVVRENLGFMRRLVKEYVDIVFANEEESIAFTGAKNASKALDEIAEMTQVAIVKLGSKGSSAKSNGETYLIPTQQVPVVDTTAAGDFFAGGFLYAYSQGAPIKECLKCGDLLASRVIQVVGTKLDEATWDSLRNEAKRILSH